MVILTCRTLNSRECKALRPWSFDLRHVISTDDLARLHRLGRARRSNCSGRTLLRDDYAGAGSGGIFWMVVSARDL